MGKYTFVSCSYRVSNKKKANDLILLTLETFIWKTTYFKTDLKLQHFLFVSLAWLPPPLVSLLLFLSFHWWILRGNSMSFAIIKRKYSTPGNVLTVYSSLPSCHLRCIRLSFLRWTQTKVFRKINNLWESFMQAYVFLKVEASNSTYSNNYSNPYDHNGWTNVFWSETIRICKKNTKYFKILNFRPTVTCACTRGLRVGMGRSIWSIDISILTLSIESIDTQI